ncbi:MAG: RusA family crossover junction endodeoxyribonuclease [Alicyclobacillus sp.]|nr:RusA family crossover junction endodeoxyribonuclease [Alicyclobacillus sp.]
MTRLVLPLPPSVNHSHRQVMNGRRLLRIPSAATREFTAVAGWRAKAWMRETGWVPTKAQKVVLRYWIWWPDGRRRDAGNVEKVMTDALVGILVDDDRYVLPRAMDYAVDQHNPRVEVELEVMET